MDEGLSAGFGRSLACLGVAAGGSWWIYIMMTTDSFPDDGDDRTWLGISILLTVVWVLLACCALVTALVIALKRWWGSGPQLRDEMILAWKEEFKTGDVRRHHPMTIEQFTALSAESAATLIYKLAQTHPQHLLILRRAVGLEIDKSESDAHDRLAEFLREVNEAEFDAKLPDVAPDLSEEITF